MRIPSTMQAIIRNSSDKLAYVTPSDDSGFKSRQSTGKGWAGKDHTLLDYSNVPTNGFKIEANIYRTYFGGGNVVWRVSDPRGFQFEIQSGNLDAIIATSSIVNGVIQGECVYARDGSTNAIVPCASPEYLECVAETERINKKVRVSSLKAGNIVVMKDGSRMIYAGKFNVIVQIDKAINKCGYHYAMGGRSYYADYERSVTQVVRHVFVYENVAARSRTHGKFHYDLIASPHVSEVVGSCSQQQLDDFVKSFITDAHDERMIINFAAVDTAVIIGVSTKPVDLSSAQVISRKMSASEITKKFSIEFNVGRRPASYHGREINHVMKLNTKTPVLVVVPGSDIGLIMNSKNILELGLDVTSQDVFKLHVCEKFRFNDIRSDKNNGSVIPRSLQYVLSYISRDENNPIINLAFSQFAVKTTSYYGVNRDVFGVTSEKTFTNANEARQWAEFIFTEFLNTLIYKCDVYEVTAKIASDISDDLDVNIL